MFPGIAIDVGGVVWEYGGCWVHPGSCMLYTTGLFTMGCWTSARAVSRSPIFVFIFIMQQDRDLKAEQGGGVCPDWGSKTYDTRGQVFKACLSGQL